MVKYVIGWPVYDLTQMRSQQEIIDRALIMNAMINIAFNAPIELIKNYINDNNLTSSLSDAEKAYFRVISRQHRGTRQSKFTLVFGISLVINLGYE